MNFKILAAVVATSLTFAGCSHVVTESTTDDGAVMIKKDAMEEAAMEEAAVQLSASNFTFKVETIEAEVGEELVVMITNDSGVHDFVIDELDISTGLIKAGETVKVVIPTDKAGSFEYYCSVGQHRELGMTGTLTIK